MFRVDKDKSRKYPNTLHGVVITSPQGGLLRVALSVEAYKMSVEVLDFVSSNVAAYTHAQARHHSTSSRKLTT